MPDLMSPEGYAATGGLSCPACGGADLAHGRTDAEQPGWVSRRWGCSTCGATWRAVYELTGYEGLTTPPEEAMKILVLDFDGVCTTYASGWQGIDVCPDPPVAGLGFFLSQAIVHFEVHIHGSRSSEEAGRDAMKHWFYTHVGQWLLDQLHFPEHKPPAFLTIDDRAMQFTGTWPDVQPLLGFQPWTRNSAPPNERPPQDAPSG